MLLITFHNDSTGTKGIGNYQINVYVNKKLIHVDRIENHKRKEGWQKLIKLFAEKLK